MIVVIEVIQNLRTVTIKAILPFRRPMHMKKTCTISDAKDTCSLPAVTASRPELSQPATSLAFPVSCLQTLTPSLLPCLLLPVYSSLSPTFRLLVLFRLLGSVSHFQSPAFRILFPVSYFLVSYFHTITFSFQLPDTSRLLFCSSTFRNLLRLRLLDF